MDGAGAEPEVAEPKEGTFSGASAQFSLLIGFLGAPFAAPKGSVSAGSHCRSATMRQRPHSVPSAVPRSRGLNPATGAGPAVRLIANDSVSEPAAIQGLARLSRPAPRSRLRSPVGGEMLGRSELTRSPRPLAGRRALARSRSGRRWR